MSNKMLDLLKPDTIIRITPFPEPVKLITAIPLRNQVKLIGTGLYTNQTCQSVLSLAELTGLQASPHEQPFEFKAG